MPSVKNHLSCIWSLVSGVKSHLSCAKSHYTSISRHLPHRNEVIMTLPYRQRYSIPILDEPFAKVYTYDITSAKETDYKNENGGIPFDSFLVDTISAGGTSDYIRNLWEAEHEVARRIRVSLKERIQAAQRELRLLLEAQEKFDKGGIKAFESFNR